MVKFWIYFESRINEVFLGHETERGEGRRDVKDDSKDCWPEHLEE
jgi:hypothetical protein